LKQLNINYVMYRLLVQFYGKNPFGERLEELGVFETPD
jgi:hypothetical protein